MSANMNNMGVNMNMNNMGVNMNMNNMGMNVDMNSPQSTKWMMSILDLDDASMANPSPDIFWPPENNPLSGTPELYVSSKEVDGHDTNNSKKRCREETSGKPVSKACREKMRRDRLNDRFVELSSVLEPGRPPKTDKATILSDAIRIISQLRVEAKKLKDSNQQLQETNKELKAEKNEIRDEKVRLKSEKESLEQQLKGMTLPSSFLPPTAFNPAAAFAAQSQAAANKTMPIHGFPGMAMWQWMPASAVDTSQDHVLRPPVA